MPRLFLFIFTCLLSATTYGAIPTPEYASERKLFTKAEQLLSSNKLKEFKELQSRLGNYPLYPYLEYSLYIKQRSSLPQQKVSRFLKEYADTPLANRLNRTWLNHLAKNKRWKAYIHHYDQFPVESTHYVCQYQVALLNGTVTQKKEAIYNARDLWVVGNSQPKSCDPLFKAWMQTGRPTSAEATERFWLTLDQGNTKLARYIDKKITIKEHKKQSQLFWKIYNSPSLVASNNLHQLPLEHQATTAVLSYKKWFRSHPISATEAWIKSSESLPIGSQQDVTSYMGTRLNSRYHSKAIELSEQLDPAYKLAELTEVRIRNALAAQEWPVIHEAIQHLPEEKKSSAKWQYWLAVAEMHLEPKGNNIARFEQISQDRSFYGYLAAEISNKPFLLNASSSKPSDTELTKLEQTPGLLRARELFKLGKLVEANREWNLAQSQMSESELLNSGYLAQSWGWHLQAIINAAKTKRWDHVDLRFPHPHQQFFAQHAVNNGLDLSFPVAIARQESAFLYTAQSHVGARGLMQLMPKTASATAKKHKVKYTSRSQLFKPELNITLGSAYLGDMYKRFDQNPAYAAAAYNAGPHRVKRWLKDRGELPLDIWIETIPFKETRNYVQNVLAFRVIYDRLQGRQASLLSEKQIQLLALNQNDIIPL